MSQHYFYSSELSVNAKGKRRSNRPYLKILTLTLALFFFADGIWIQAKAWLAQYLIASAWAEQVEMQQEMTGTGIASSDSDLSAIKPVS